MKSNSDSTRLLRKYPDTPTLNKEIKMKMTSDLLESIAITSENTSVLNREIETLMNELMELFKKDTTNKFRELGAEMSEIIMNENLNTPINYLEIFN